MVIITDSAIQFSATNQQTAVYPAIGTILLWGGYQSSDLINTDYLICDGSELLQAGQYNPLYLIVGDKYGPATAGYFKLPDLRERIPVGADVSGNVTYGGVRYGGVNKLVDAHYPHTHNLNVTFWTTRTRRGAEAYGGTRDTCNAVSFTNTDSGFIDNNNTNPSEYYYPEYTLVNYIIKAKTTLYTS